MSDDSELRNAMEIGQKSAALSAAAAAATAASIKKYLEYRNKDKQFGPVQMVAKKTYEEVLRNTEKAHTSIKKFLEYRDKEKSFVPIRMVRRQIYQEVLRNTEKAHTSIKKFLDEASSSPAVINQTKVK